MKLGRPQKYKTESTLRKAAEKYFSSISKTVAVGEENDEGEPLMVVEYIRPPTVSGLCKALGIDRSTWQNYCDEKMHPEFKAITQAIRGELEVYLEEQLLTRDKVQGIIFNLQNNYEWRQKEDVQTDVNIKIKDLTNGS